MTRQYLLDTNVLSEPVNGRPDPGVLARLHDHERAVCTAAPVWHELIFGWQRLPNGFRRDTVGQYLEEVVEPNVPILPYDRVAARWHGEERRRLTALGMTPPFVDGMIAAIASVNGLVVVTRNTKDFASFTRLEVEDWFER